MVIYATFYFAPNNPQVWMGLYCRWKRDQFVVIVFCVAKRDQTFMLTSIVPIKAKAREIPVSSNVISDILDAYKGQLIYLDIWATWCGPCKIAFPYSRMLIKEFEDKEVAFLFFCCASHKDDWNNFMIKEEMPGEHYFLTKEEYKLLDDMFDIQGFPTYILIDKNGQVITKRADRPYEGSPISDKINELLI